MKDDLTAKYMALAAEVQSQLDRIGATLHDADPDRLNWGHIGDLGRIRDDLANICEYRRA